MSQPRITYDGDPFIITGKHLHDCHNGTDRHAADKQRTKKCLGDKHMIVMLKDMLIHEPTDATFLCPLPALKRKSL